jgi:hypothetical protein
MRRSTHIQSLMLCDQRWESSLAISFYLGLSHFINGLDLSNKIIRHERRHCNPLWPRNTSHKAIRDEQVELQNGVSMQSDVVHTNPEDRQTHASIPPWIFHAAWCWADFIPFFCFERYPVVALSWRGTGGIAGEGSRE